MRYSIALAAMIGGGAGGAIAFATVWVAGVGALPFAIFAIMSVSGVVGVWLGRTR